jgi:hypothetical protein
MRSARATQRQTILQLLIAARGEWVSLPTIAECAAQYNARIHELRGLGFRIANRTKLENGVTHSWYRLKSQTPQAAALQEKKLPMSTTNYSFPQVGRMEPEGRYPD